MANDNKIHLMKTEHIVTHYAIPKSELTPRQLKAIEDDPNGEAWEWCEGDAYKVNGNDILFSNFVIERIDNPLM